MLKVWSSARVAALGSLLAIGTVIATAVPASAGGYHDEGHAYCDEAGYNCYQVRPGDRDYRDERDERRDSYRDRDEYRDGYRDRDDDRDDYHREGYDSGWRTVCDPDGDRCYRSASDYWNYREYYRRLGYRWND